MELGLSRMRHALAALDLEHPARAVVQVVGTNGKGATATLVAALCAAHGLSCGLYTSPHFLSVRERIRCYRGDIPGAAATPGAPLCDGFSPESDWTAAARSVLAATAPLGESGRLTYFELLTVMAARLFASRGVDVAVFEAGLGGSHDATTAFSRDMAVFTPIGMDHAHVLGPALADIARDKAGAIPGTRLAVTGPQTPAAMAELTSRADAAGASLAAAHRVLDYDAAAGTARFHAPGRATITDAPLGLPGAYQAANAATALAAFSLLADGIGLAVSPGAVRRALGETRLPGRMQRLRPPGAAGCLLLDCAHNVPAMTALAAALSDGGVAPAAMIFTCLADKDFEGMAGIVRRLTPGPIVVPGLHCPGRTRHPADVARGIGERAVAVPDVAAALSRVRDIPGTILVCGSMYLLAEVMGRFNIS